MSSASTACRRILAGIVVGQHAILYRERLFCGRRGRLQCIAVVRGERCRRKATPGAQMCLYRVTWFKGPDAPDACQARVGREARRLVRQAKSKDGLDNEIALLRLVIRDCVATGQNKSARRTIVVLTRLLLVEAQLKAVESGSERRGSQSRGPRHLVEVLDRLGAEFDD